MRGPAGNGADHHSDGLKDWTLIGPNPATNQYGALLTALTPSPWTQPLNAPALNPRLGPAARTTLASPYQLLQRHLDTTALTETA